MPFFDKFSEIEAKFSCILPTLFIVALCAIAGIFSVVGGIFAFYANKNVELTLDSTISSVFDIFPDRTLTIPEISLAYFTQGAVNLTFSIDPIVFLSIQIFRNLIQLDSDTGLYKALNLYNILNLSNIITTVGDNLVELGEEIYLPESVQEFINNLYNNIASLVPDSFSTFYDYMYDETITKVEYVRSLIENDEDIAAEVKEQLYEYLDNIAYWESLMEQDYNTIYETITNTLYNLFIDAPDLIIDLVKYACTNFGGVIQKSSPIVDEALNQVPVGFVQGAYNVVYNAFFADLIDGASYYSAGALICIVAITAMLICIMFGYKMKSFESSTDYFEAP